ncbi:MAG: hypothetical protein FWD60_09355 [Candidatus Azobacteroides sp.]|nr:hypothetical protein [Candidatus Azobacteroides sp.]
MGKTLLAFFIVIFFTISCSNNKYSDGNYYADVEYYIPRTGTHSTYTLSVEIENNKLTVIHFPNGGWLDNSHFTPPTIKDGKAKFVSDRGYRYTVKILYRNDSSTGTTRNQSFELTEEQEELLKNGNLDYDDLTPEQQEYVDENNDNDALRDEYNEYIRETGSNIDYQEYIEEREY